MYLLKISYIFKKALGLSIFFAVCVVMNTKNYLRNFWFKHLKIVGLITNIEEYQKIYNHD